MLNILYKIIKLEEKLRKKGSEISTDSTVQDCKAGAEPTDL
jgi:hypothetical protein